MSFMADFTRALVLAHCCVPSRDNGGAGPPSAERYFCTKSRRVSGTYSRAPSAYSSTINSAAARGTRAQPERHVVFAKNVSQALDFASRTGAEHHAFAFRRDLLHFLSHRRNRPVEARSGLRLKLNRFHIAGQDAELLHGER